MAYFFYAYQIHMHMYRNTNTRTSISEMDILCEMQVCIQIHIGEKSPEFNAVEPPVSHRLRREVPLCETYDFFPCLVFQSTHVRFIPGYFAMKLFLKSDKFCYHQNPFLISMYKHGNIQSLTFNNESHMVTLLDVTLRNFKLTYFEMSSNMISFI